MTDGEEQTAEESADAADGVPEEPKTGMKLSILGDSISTFKGWIPEGNLVFYPENGTVKDVAQTWWKIVMGTNDVLMSAAIGDNDGLQAVGEGLVGSLSDGYTMILDKIKRQYPQAQVYCCTLLPVGDWGTTEAQPFVPFVNGQNVTSEAYSERIRLIAGNRGLPIIDLEKCGITIDNMAEMTADGVHPTAEGMRLIADTVKKCLTE